VSTLLAPIATVSTLAWVTLILTAPRLPTMLAASMYGIGSLICHQRPERSFHLAGAQLPVCARCLGIYAGAALGVIVASWSVPYARRVPGLPAVALLISALPTVVTLVVEWFGLWDPGNVLRAAAGMILGAGVAVVVVTLHYDECALRRPIASNPRRPPI
jgi:uncharacterized membrane protein